MPLFDILLTDKSLSDNQLSTCYLTNDTKAVHNAMFVVRLLVKQTASVFRVGRWENVDDV